MKYFFNIKDKFIFYSVLTVFLFLLGAAEKIQASRINIQVNPSVVLVDEPAELRLSSSINYPSIKKFPNIPGLKWDSTVPRQSSQIRIVNSRRTAMYTSVYSFTVNRPGTFKIPSLTGYLGQSGIKLKSITFHARKHNITLKDGKKATLDDLLYASAVLDTDRDYIYLGEEVPLEIKLYSLQGLNLTCSWPEIKAEKIVIRDYSKVNQEAPNFMRPVRKSVVLDNQKFNVDVFATAIRPISTGEFQGKTQIKCQLSVSSRGGRNGFFDDLIPGFFGGSYRVVNRNIIAELPNKEIKQLPEPPENSNFLGLVGNWKMNISLDSKKLLTGEPATLTVKVSGKGSLDTLNAPELKISGFIVYPPEITKSERPDGSYSSVEIKYAVIPKEQGPVLLDLSFCIFQTNTEKYQKTSYHKKFIVTKGNNHTAVIDDAAESLTVQEMQKQASMKNRGRQGILSLKNTDSNDKVLLPLIRNHAFLIYFFLFLGPLVFIVFEFYKRYHIKLNDNPELRRMKNAKRNKRKIKALLNNCRPEELNEVVKNELIPFLNDLYGFSPGTSVNEIADRIDDEELSNALNAVGSQSYMPGTVHQNPEQLKSNLINAMKKLLTFILLIITFSVYADNLNNSAERLNQPKVKLATPEEAYAAGMYNKAEKLYRQMLKRKQNSPAVLYNIGNCLYKQGHLPQALVFFEQANRLAPSDSDIRENLNLVRRKLMLPEIDKVKNPIDSLKNIRDSLRPDEWLLVAAFLWFLIWIILIFRWFLSMPALVSTVSIVIIALILSLISYFAQLNSTYSSKYALVVKKAPVYTLPTDVSEKSEFELTPGSEVTIEEQRHSWDRIRNDESEGWVKSDVIQPFCPFH